MCKKRPILIRMLPDRLKLAAWHRLYRPTTDRWQPLFVRSPLRFAPQIKMDLRTGDIISDCIAFTGFYELGLSRRITELSKCGGTMVDIGANMGYFSLLWASGNPANRCYAFEASPNVIEMLRHNVAINKLGSQVEVFHKAAGKEAGVLPFNPGPIKQTGWGGFAVKQTASTVEVPVVRVDETVSGPIDLLKIDIEGADTWALRGCEGLLKNRLIKEIWFEQNKPRMKELGIGENEAQEFLGKLGYKLTLHTNMTQPIVEWQAVPS